LATTRTCADKYRLLPSARGQGTMRLLVLQGRVLAWKLGIQKYVHSCALLLSNPRIDCYLVRCKCDSILPIECPSTKNCVLLSACYLHDTC
jgi:hypothetical protein